MHGLTELPGGSEGANFLYYFNIKDGNSIKNIFF